MNNIRAFVMCNKEPVINTVNRLQLLKDEIWCDFYVEPNASLDEVRSKVSPVWLVKQNREKKGQMVGFADAAVEMFRSYECEWFLFLEDDVTLSPAILPCIKSMISVFGPAKNRRAIIDCYLPQGQEDQAAVMNGSQRIGWLPRRKGFFKVGTQALVFSRTIMLEIAETIGHRIALSPHYAQLDTAVYAIADAKGAHCYQHRPSLAQQVKLPNRQHHHQASFVV